MISNINQIKPIQKARISPKFILPTISSLLFGIQSGCNHELNHFSPKNRMPVAQSLMSTKQQMQKEAQIGIRDSVSYAAFTRVISGSSIMLKGRVDAITLQQVDKVNFIIAKSAPVDFEKEILTNPLLPIDTTVLIKDAIIFPTSINGDLLECTWQDAAIDWDAYKHIYCYLQIGGRRYVTLLNNVISSVLPLSTPSLVSSVHQVIAANKPGQSVAVQTDNPSSSSVSSVYQVIAAPGQSAAAQTSLPSPSVSSVHQVIAANKPEAANSEDEWLDEVYAEPYDDTLEDQPDNLLLRLNNLSSLIGCSSRTDDLGAMGTESGETISSPDDRNMDRLAIPERSRNMITSVSSEDSGVGR